MNLVFLFLLFILCLLLPTLLNLLEGLEYDTKELDAGVHHTTTPEERAAIEQKIKDAVEKKKNEDKKIIENNYKYESGK